jgi:integrase/recombinase XerD
MDKNIAFVEICRDFLTRRYNSTKTINCYLKEIEWFLKDKNPYYINMEDIQNHLNKYKDSGRSKQNQVIASMKCLYLDVLKRKNFNYKFVRAKRKEYLPTLMSKEEIKSRLDKIPNIKHKAICSLLYGCGLRLDELLSLKLSDILSKQNLIKIVQGKGSKDRFVPLSENLLKLLREYYNRYKPTEYLFEGQSKTTKKYSSGSVGEIVEKYFGKEFHPHLLRHCYGTHLHEAGVELSKIQKLMGHANIKSTQIYTKTANNLQNLPSLI